MQGQFYRRLLLLIAGPLYFCWWFVVESADLHWVIGAFAIVVATSMVLTTVRALWRYSIFIFLLSIVFVYINPKLESSVFLPGIVMLLIQANLGLRSRLRVIKSLEEAKRRFEELFNATFEGVLIHENGIVIDLNATLAHMIEYRREDVIGKPALDLIHPDDRALVARQIATKSLLPSQVRFLKSSGASLDVDARAKNVFYDGRPARLVTIQDLRDRKRAESAIESAQALRENVRVRDEFISVASHELKTPIATLKLQTQIVLRELKRGSTYGPARVMEFASLLGRQADRLSELVSTMLDVSQIAAGRLVLEVKPIDLCEMVREAVSSQILSVNAPPEISADLPARGLPSQADRSRLRQVVENLLSNAIKYGQGRPIHVRAFHERGRAVISVADQGIGITPEMLPRIFNRFERGVSSRNISGLGLGLYIAKQIVDAHKGEILVTTSEKSGTEFKVYLPAT